MINAQDIKIELASAWTASFISHRLACMKFKPGNISCVLLKDVVNGYVLERRFNIGEKLEDVRVERRPHQYLYHDGDNYQFMNQETFDQIPIAHDLINGVDFLLEGMVVDVVSDASTETVLYADVPVKVRDEDYLHRTGSERRYGYQHANLQPVESGATVRVPLFINEGGLSKSTLATVLRKRVKIRESFLLRILKPPD